MESVIVMPSMYGSSPRAGRQWLVNSNGCKDRGLREWLVRPGLANNLNRKVDRSRILLEINDLFLSTVWTRLKLHNINYFSDQMIDRRIKMHLNIRLVGEIGGGVKSQSNQNGVSTIDRLTLRARNASGSINEVLEWHRENCSGDIEYEQGSCPCIAAANISRREAIPSRGRLPLARYSTRGDKAAHGVLPHIRSFLPEFARRGADFRRLSTRSCQNTLPGVTHLSGRQ